MKEPALTRSSASATVAVILAGGGSVRMGGNDKAVLELGGQRMIDRVIARLAPQAGRMVIAGDDDYATGLTIIPDRGDGPAGPAAGLWAVLHWLEVHLPDMPGFITVPVDGPFLPYNLCDKLCPRQGEPPLGRAPGCRIAVSAGRDHPTFAYWPRARLRTVLTAAACRQGCGQGLSLGAIAEGCGAERVMFDAASLSNINTPADARAASARLHTL